MFHIVTPCKVCVFQAESHSRQEKWISVLRTAVNAANEKAEKEKDEKGKKKEKEKETEKESRMQKEMEEEEEQERKCYKRELPVGRRVRQKLQSGKKIL